jgi:hypothetical protein
MFYCLAAVLPRPIVVPRNAHPFLLDLCLYVCMYAVQQGRGGRICDAHTTMYIHTHLLTPFAFSVNTEIHIHELHFRSSVINYIHRYIHTMT